MKANGVVLKRPPYTPEDHRRDDFALWRPWFGSAWPEIEQHATTLFDAYAANPEDDTAWHRLGVFEGRISDFANPNRASEEPNPGLRGEALARAVLAKPTTATTTATPKAEPTMTPADVIRTLQHKDTSARAGWDEKITVLYEANVIAYNAFVKSLTETMRAGSKVRSFGACMSAAYRRICEAYKVAV